MNVLSLEKFQNQSLRNYSLLKTNKNKKAPREEVHMKNLREYESSGEKRRAEKNGQRNEREE